MRLTCTDASSRAAVRSGIETNLKRYWKHTVGLLVVNAFNGILFYANLESCWLRVLLSFFGLSMSVFWACINWVSPFDFGYWPRPDVRHRYSHATSIADELGLLSEWFLVFLSAFSNVILGGMLAVYWVTLIARYVAPFSLSSFELFASFGLGISIFAITIPIYPKAITAECSIMLACDHLLREEGLRAKSKGKIYEISCLQCRQLYYTPEPLFTRGLCKQCYGNARFVAEWWIGVAGFGMFLWSLSLRELAIHLVPTAELKWAAWLALFFVSGVLWYPLVRGRWFVLFFRPWRDSRNSRYPHQDLESVPPPRLLVDNDVIKPWNSRIDNQ